MTQLQYESRVSAAPFDWRGFLETYGSLFALILLVGFSLIFSSSFRSLENALNILRQNSFIGIVAVGMTFVIILGGIDLSVGSLLAFSGGLGIWMMDTAIRANTVVPGVDGGIRVALAGLSTKMGIAGSEGWGVAVAAATIILTGALAGWLNGLMVAKGRLAPFIATLGAMAAYRSLALSLADGGEFRSASMDLFPTLGAGGIPLFYVRGVPITLGYPVLVFAAVAVLGHILLNSTRYGRYVYAIGCNERTAVYSAINVDRIKLLTYTLAGAACGLAALLLSSRMNSVSSSGTGTLYELDAIAAVAIGGTRMSGGSGRVWGTVVGVLILGVIGNMLNMMSVSPYLQGLVKGLIIVAAVLLQRSSRATA